MTFHSVGKWIGRALIFSALAVPAYFPTHAIEPRAGMWSVGGSAGIIGNTPNGTSFALNVYADRFLDPTISFGPLLQVANFEQVAPSLQFKYWMDVSLPNPDAKMNFQAGGGFIHAEGESSYIIPLGIGLDYPMDRNFSLTATLLLNFTHLDAGLGQGTHLMPSITVGLRY
jgi:hypothetical protein